MGNKPQITRMNWLDNPTSPKPGLENLVPQITRSIREWTEKIP